MRRQVGAEAFRVEEGQERAEPDPERDGEEDERVRDESAEEATTEECGFVDGLGEEEWERTSLEVTLRGVTQERRGHDDAE